MKESQNNGVHAWLVLWKATRSLEAHALQSIESLDMCGSDFAILEALLHKGPMPVNSIGQKNPPYQRLYYNCRRSPGQTRAR